MKLIQPVISPRAMLARDAVVCGDVTLEAESSLWFHAVLRAEAASIRVGAGSNIQDNCVIHVDEGFDVDIGPQVTVGHGSILHGCTVGQGSLIGMGSTVLNGARIGSRCLIGAGSLVTQNTVIPDGSLAFGRPARVVRPLTEQEIAQNLASAADYVEEARAYCEAGCMECRRTDGDGAE